MNPIDSRLFTAISLYAANQVDLFRCGSTRESKQRATRYHAAYLLALDGELLEKGNNYYEVKGSKGKIHTARLHPSPSCTCEFATYHPGEPCKHVLAIEIVERARERVRELLAEEARVAEAQLREARRLLVEMEGL